MRPASGPSASTRPAGADNFLKWRRSIDEHLELGRLRFHEYAMFSWLCTKADPHTGTLRTSWTTLAEQTTLTVNLVCKLGGNLKRKGYIDFPAHRGRRRKLVKVAIDKFPLPDGTYTALPRPARGTRAEVLAEVPAEVLAEVPAELGGQNARESGTSLGGRSRKRKRSRSTLRVRQADLSTETGITDPSKPTGVFTRDEALAAAPRALRETVELFWLKTGRDGLTEDDLAALRELDQAHTPAVIQKTITESVERFTRRGDDPRGLTFGYVWESLKRFTTRKSPAPPASQHPAYPPGLTRLN